MAEPRVPFSELVAKLVDQTQATAVAHTTIVMLVGETRYREVLPEIERRMKLFGNDPQAALDAANSVLDDVSVNRYPRIKSQLKGILNVDE